MKVVVLLILGLACLAAAKKPFEGYKVYSVSPKTELQNAFLRSLDGDEKYDMWSDVNKIGLPVKIMIGPEDQMEFINKMHSIGLDVSIFIDDVSERMKAEKVGRYSRSGMTWTQYYRLNDIYTWMDEMAVRYPDKVTSENLGTSYEGRPTKGVKISFGAGKKVVFIEGGIHAREWISPATCTYIINELLTSTDPAFRKVAEAFDWYIFPVTNPDGYEFTHTNNRMWRKTRTVYAGTCRGADPNRNWDAHWGYVGASSSCSSDVFMGPRPFSEKETDNLSKYIIQKAPNMVAYISFHSFSQLLMVPYGHTYERLDNYNETVAVGNVAVTALASRYGTRYVVGNIAETIYQASGGSIDWVKQEFQTPLVYCYELRDRGTYGFLLPPNQIIPNNEEVMDSLTAMFVEADRLGVVSMN